MNMRGIPLAIDSILIGIKKVIHNVKRNVLMGDETRHVIELKCNRAIILLCNLFSLFLMKCEGKFCFVTFFH